MQNIDCRVKYLRRATLSCLLTTTFGIAPLARPAAILGQEVAFGASRGDVPRPTPDGRGPGQSLADLTATPEAAAELFIRSIRAIRWSAAAQFISPETLERFRTTATMIADADTTGVLRDFLVGVDSAGMAELASAEVFARSIGSVIDDLPGLMHALYDRDDEVLGSVPDGPDRAHVVYRTTARLSGAVPEVEVMQLARGAEGWRVTWSDELDVIEEALRGVGR